MPETTLEEEQEYAELEAVYHEQYREYLTARENNVENPTKPRPPKPPGFVGWLGEE